MVDRSNSLILLSIDEQAVQQGCLSGEINDDTDYRQDRIGIQRA
jgi:hypothetical protein